MIRRIGRYPASLVRYTLRQVRESFPGLPAPRFQVLPALGSVAGALAITLTFIAATPEARGEWSEPDPMERAEEAAGERAPEFAFAARLYGVDVLVGAADEPEAPEGGIDESEHAEAAAVAPEAVATGGRFVLPLKNWTAVTDRFGAYRGPGWLHGGIDLDVPNTARTPIYAACGGTVSYTGYSSTYGYHVVIDCGEGWATLYGHMSAIYVSAGGTAVIGETVLGTTGNTGYSMGEHLHFEIHWNGVRVNPERYLDFGIAPGAPLSTGPAVYVPARPSTGGGSSAGSSSSGGSGGSSRTDTPAATTVAGKPSEAATAVPTETPSPTVAPTKTPTPIPTPTQVPIPSHGTGLGECPRSDSGAVNCGPGPHAVVCAPTGWFLDYGGNFTNPRGWPVTYVTAVLDATSAC